jgi:hypothetical protein
MIHEFEEFIFFPGWLQKNKNRLADRFPKLSKYTLNKMGNISTSAFALAVFEEYVIVILITASAIYFDFYGLWTGMFTAFSIHLIIHIIQWLIIRKYVPFIVTSILCLPYCIYVFNILITTQNTDYKTIVFWTIVGIVATGLNLLFAHKIAIIFDKRFTKKNNYTE